jgi:hypothetical protein
VDCPECKSKHPGVNGPAKPRDIEDCPHPWHDTAGTDREKRLEAVLAAALSTLQETDARVEAIASEAKAHRMQFLQEVGHQGSATELQLWVLLDPAADYEARGFAIYGTGNPMPSSPGEYLDTVITPGLVWHVFELPKEEE